MFVLPGRSLAVLWAILWKPLMNMLASWGGKNFHSHNAVTLDMCAFFLEYSENLHEKRLTICDEMLCAFSVCVCKKYVGFHRYWKCQFPLYSFIGQDAGWDWKCM